VNQKLLCVFADEKSKKCVGFAEYGQREYSTGLFVATNLKSGPGASVGEVRIIPCVANIFGVWSGVPI